MTITNGMRPIHPGEILREEFMIPLGLSANALAIALRVHASRINDIARERCAISADTALRLARCFGASGEFWLGLQSDYDMKIALAEHGVRINQDIAPMVEQARERTRCVNAGPTPPRPHNTESWF